MLYMLDTNMCSYIIRNKPQNIKEKLKSVEKDHTIALSTVVVSELIYGAKKKGAEKLFDLVLSFIENFQIMDFDKNSALAYATICLELETTGDIIGSNDLFIAAHAKGSDAILVTNNTKEFERVKGLRLENWVS
jgi:tRNA(fMet)-specific endonuclease VapC